MRTEVDRLEKRIRERFVKAFVTYHLIEDGDHILVALSGGKDSLCLLEMLGKRAKIDKPQFKVEAIHVRMENIAYETSTDYLQHFCDDLGVKLHIVTTSFSATPTDQNSQFSTPNSQFKPKPPCFLCSWNRRKQMFNLAQELGCNKIALGHHQDDLLHTSMMNLFYQGRFDTTLCRIARLRKAGKTLSLRERQSPRRHAHPLRKHSAAEPRSPSQSVECSCQGRQTGRHILNSVNYPFIPHQYSINYRIFAFLKKEK